MAYKYSGSTFVEDEPVIVSGCGTYAGYRAHLRKDEDTCRDCKDAANSYWRNNYEQRKTRGRKVFQFTPDKCGTNAGYARHYFYKQPACEPCRKAAAQYMADYRARKAA
ncbi:hypothetical protein ACFRJ8_14890 [Arthrobacter sp. NPDC056886]|uniref:hypothetical protein n=1 Tax=Arthrobacter sp. NPDC056886 TaxID=3345960 RepID=UPI003670CB99